MTVFTEHVTAREYRDPSGHRNAPYTPPRVVGAQIGDCYFATPLGCYSKSFDPKTSSRSVVPGVKFPPSLPHAQKINLEPSGMTMIMRKNHSPYVRLVMAFMMGFMMSD